MTSPRIRRLPQVVAEAIAAGEVVERPASVVKELLENAIDAGADRISVDVRGAGFVHIEVSDNGCGIAAPDMELAVAAHATSKLDGLAALGHVTTLGFRGEALASIAAVSDLRIVSSTVEAEHGMSLQARHGAVVHARPEASAQGTRVSVDELFANTPARLRFMRSERAETAAIRRMCADLAVCQPGIAIVLRSDGVETLRSPGSGVLRECAAAIFGAADRELVEVDAPGDVGVRGVLSAVTSHQGSRSGLVIAVNGRRVHNRTLTVAVEEAYRGLLPADRHPFGVVMLSLDPAAVDVNVHPTKREVRFHDERRVFAALQRACWAALRSGRIDVPRAQITAPAQLMDSHDPNQVGSFRFEDAPAPPDAEGVELSALGELTLVGQVNGEWLVAASPAAVVLIDPHAAHEKVLYHRLLERLQRHEGGDAQQLLMPALVALDPRRWEVYQQGLEQLRELGFAVEEFGQSTVRCQAVPLAATRSDPERLLCDALDAMSEDAAGRAQHRVAAVVACHGAVRFGDVLALPEQEAILRDLLRTPGAATCPHGRPTAVVFEERMLRRAFRRPLE